MVTPATAWEIRLDVQDTLQTVQDARVVPSGAKVLDAWPTGEVALGKLIDPDGPKTQLDGPARIYGDLTVDGSLSSLGRLLPYACAAGTIAQPTPSGTTVTAAEVIVLTIFTGSSPESTYTVNISAASASAP